MKRLLTLLLMLSAATCVKAQDTIYKTDSQSIQAKILEISPSEVRYKRFSNQQGPTYVLPVGQIAYIVYQNGERDDFNAVQTQNAAPDKAEAAPETKPAEPATPQNPKPADETRETERMGWMVQQPQQQQPQPQQQYSPYRRMPEPGMIYDQDGVRGIIIDVDEDGEHGLLLSLEQSSEPSYRAWTLIRDPYPDTGATDKSDGMKNMEAVAAYIAANGLSWDDFPAFKWCRDLGEGWYLPSVDEMLKVSLCYNGGQRIKFDRKARQTLNERIKQSGGDKLDRMVDYFTSTASGDGMATTTSMNFEPPYVDARPMHERYLVRAVRRF